MRVAVIGAGTMGAGIAQAFAAAGNGFEVLLCDVSSEVAQNGKHMIVQSLERLVSKERLRKLEKDVILSRISTGTLEIAIGCNMVIEAAVENMKIKKEIFRLLDETCGADTLLATNTSSLSITEIGAGLEHDVVGMHFFNPAPVMKLVEIIAGINTQRSTIERAIDITKQIDKTPVEVKEGAGFVVNRVLIPMVNEAIGILSEGIASAEDVDTSMKLGANHPMGPLALGDLIGLDVCLAIMEVLHLELGEDKYRPHPLLRKMVRGGMLGKKTGRGFFEYEAKNTQVK